MLICIFEVVAKVIIIVGINHIEIFLSKNKRRVQRGFRKQNISYASLGEKHMWLYDNFLMSEILKKEN